MYYNTHTTKRRRLLVNISIPGVLEGLGLMLSGDPGLGRGVSPGKGPGPGAPPRGNWSAVSGGATPPATPPGLNPE